MRDKGFLQIEGMRLAFICWPFLYKFARNDFLHLFFTFYSSSDFYHFVPHDRYKSNSDTYPQLIESWSLKFEEDSQGGDKKQKCCDRNCNSNYK